MSDHSYTGFLEPSIAGDQILLEVSQVYSFLDGTVSRGTQKISAESRKSLNTEIKLHCLYT